MTNKILLTGAGFSHNFGFPLAKDVRWWIFNHPELKQLNKIRKLLLDSKTQANYEIIYTEVINDPTFAEERAIFLAIIDYIFNTTFENICLSAINAPKQNGISISELRKFIMKFSGINNFLFTVNQDLFLERLFLKDEGQMLCSPYMGNCIYNYGDKKDSALFHPLHEVDKYNNWKNTDCVVPENKELQERIKNWENRKDPLPLYYKLHGSIGWKYKDNNKIPLVMGTSKKESIKNEPIFSEYFKIFQQALSQQASKLFIIGYSFLDTHINDLIVQSIDNFGLKIHILNPMNLFDLLESIHKTPSYKPIRLRLLNSLEGYYPYFLRDVFPFENNSESRNINILYEQICNNYFVD